MARDKLSIDLMIATKHAGQAIAKEIAKLEKQAERLGKTIG